MLTNAGWLNATRVVGLVAYGIAVTCGGFAWMRQKHQRRDWRLAALLTIIEATLLLDIAFSWRWSLHQLLVDSALRTHEYQARRIPQLIVLILLAGFLVAGLLLVRLVLARRSPGGKGGASLAICGVSLSLGLWLTEVVSLHQVDQVLYHTLGGVMVISLLWAVACLMASIGILLDLR